MSHRERPARSFLLAVTALVTLNGTAVGSSDTATPGGATGVAAKPAARKDEWPKPIRLGEARMFLDSPQAESLEGTKLKARGTAEFLRRGATEPVYGTIWYEAEVEINRNRRMATLVSVHVPRIQFAGIPPARQQQIANRLSQEVTRLQVRLPLDDVLAGAKLARHRGGTPPKLGTDAPTILFEAEPAILVLFDGEPRFHPVEGARLERALNTPFLVLHDAAAHAYYLDGGTSWFRASDLKGPWAKAADVPSEAVQIARRDLKDAGVADSDVEEAAKSAEKRDPKILVATSPTELIVSDGPPQWRPEVEGELNAMSNSDSDVFQTLPDGRVWLVLSGRWYRSEAMTSWAYVEPDNLPQSFHKIRAESAKASVLTFVPGTRPAREALRDANTPKTAAVRRSEAHVNVTYDGDPKFESVPGTHVEYALNTPEQVLKIRGRFFVCDQGVWFSSSKANGPWAVADSIPDDEIQEIPPESPVYNTRFVSVYDSTPDTVYVAYTPAYLGSYPYYGTVVFGTGWFYRPWWGAYYYPRPWTWGFCARYGPWGGWGFGFSWGPAWGGFRYGFGYGWGARWCGPGAFFRPAFANVSMTRNVNITRNVNVTRNVYNSGVNTTRATPQGSAASSMASKSAAAPRSASRAQGARAQGAKPEGTKPQGAKAKGAKPNQPKGKAGGKAGGGKKH